MIFSVKEISFYKLITFIILDEILCILKSFYRTLENV